ncbi:Toll/interleukin-1 receptor-like protein [Cardamine amara subsp. amara]|uniref:Toll/interleukin-1 receptor-like protein n=1 Tax=Cardamine amara subsp. amara TaxID=228776 RepID=A0ABD0ZFL7_CARAN
MSTTHRKYDVFLSFRGLDTRRNFISFFYRELVRSNIQTFKDDMDLESGRRISPELKRAIEESKFAVVVVSENYTASPWCLEELVEIMDLEENGLIEVIPIFYGVDPSHVRRQIEDVAKHFKKHEGREDQDPEKVLSWRQALTKLADLSGYCACESCKWADEWEMVNEITDKISKRLMIAKPRRNGNKLEEIDTHMEALYQLLNLNSNQSVRVIGIWARGGNGRTAFAKFVYESISQHFQSHCFLESVKRISQDRHMSHLHQEFLEKIQGEYSNKSMLKKQKVLLVADDANKLEQLDALADDFNCFGPGSIVIITTQDKQLLNSYGITLVYEVDLKFQNDLLRQPAFKRIGVLCRQLSFKKRDEMVRLSTR